VISATPNSSNLFSPVADTYGVRLALVFGNHFTRGRCPFFERQCWHCDIGAGEGGPFNTQLNKSRLDFFSEHYRSVLPDVAHLVVYNSGSTLNPLELPRDLLGLILAFARSLPRCRAVSFDTREQFVTSGALDVLIRGLRGDQKPRIGLGLETQDDHLRLEVLKKRMLKPLVQAAFRETGRRTGDVGVDINIVVQPPYLTDVFAIAEAVETARFALDTGARWGVPVDINIHPFYVSKIAKRMFPGVSRARQDVTKAAVMEIRRLFLERGAAGQVFIGWQDESHDQDENPLASELATDRLAFAAFNVTQDPMSLAAQDRSSATDAPLPRDHS
jgi:hypothetical protein